MYQHAIIHSSAWKVLVLLTVLLASFMYFYGLKGVLPYTPDPDEPIQYIGSEEIRHGAASHIKPLYPPIGFYKEIVEEALLDIISGGQATRTIYFFFGRASSGYTLLILLAVIYQIGHRLHSRLAGALCVILVAFNLQMVTFAHLNRADSLSWLLSGFVILQSIELVKSEKKSAWFVIIVCSVIAFFTRYSVFSLAVIPGYFILRKALQHPKLRWGVIVGGLITLALSVTILFYLRANANFWQGLLWDIYIEFLLSDNIPVSNNLIISLASFQSDVGNILIIIGVCGLPIVWALKSRVATKHFVVILLLIAMIISIIPVAALKYLRPRDVVLIIITWTTLCGIFLAMFTVRTFWLGIILTPAIVFASTTPKLQQGWQFIQTFTKPHTYAELGNWFLYNVPEGARTVTESLTPFNSYVGFPGRAIYHQAVSGSILRESIQEYRERGYEYLIWDSFKGENGIDDPYLLESQPTLTNAQKVFRMVGDNRYEGPSIIVFKIEPIQQHVRYLWFTPSISFRGYDLNKETLKPGDDLELMFYWMSAERVKANYIVFVHVISAETGELLVGKDEPTDNGYHPTWTWGGDMQFIRDRHILTIPATAKAGTYIVRFGMYDADTQARVQVSTPKNEPVGDVVALQEIRIEK